jgi:hypothetical protein
MRQPPRLEIRFLGTYVNAQGFVGIFGTIAIMTVLLAASLAAYFGH